MNHRMMQRVRTPAARRAAGWIARPVGCLLLICSFATHIAFAAEDPSPRPSASERLHDVETTLGFRSERLDLIDPLIADAITAGRMPGCVVAIGRRGGVARLRAYGHRSLPPEGEAVEMTTETVFDLASLTKPLATAMSVMQLIDQGKIRLHDPVARYLPEFAANGKERVTIEQLLTHVGGLIPDNALADYQDGAAEAKRRVFDLGLNYEPGAKFRYTDVGFIVLGELVERVAATTLNDYCRENIYGPLKMSDTGYLPDAQLRARAAPTERRENAWIIGEVHDPRAYLLGGVAGHAGLFSTADDLSRFARMMLGQGELDSVRVLSPAAWRVMTQAYRTPGGLRGLGWDKQSVYSSNRGDTFTEQAFGHGGFTGTVIWMDPGLDLFVVFLSNRLHPDGQGSVNRLAGRIGAIAASAVQPPATRTNPSTIAKTELLLGVDVLQRSEFEPLQGKRVGLITNQTGVNREGISTARLLHQAPQVNLVALFSPEHGIEGKLDQASISNQQDPLTGLKVFSLYGETRRPTPEMLSEIDVLVFDIQDIGARFYTYISTMSLAMQACAEQGVEFVVLDRPNPIDGIHVQGPMLDEGRESFIAAHRLPIRHGMTVGELARLMDRELQLSCELTVVPLEGWEPNTTHDQNGLLWINPSPNMRNVNQALLYPGVGLLETTNVSVGRGVDTPFEVVGAPWIEPRAFRQAVLRRSPPGVTVTPLWFTPDSSVHAGQRCGGVRLAIVDRQTFQPLELGLALALALRELYPQKWDFERYNRLLLHQATCDAIRAGAEIPEILQLWKSPLKEFLERRREFLLYPRNPAQ